MGFKGLLIGSLIILLGFLVVFTFVSPDFLFLIGLDIRTYNSIQAQLGVWWPVIGVSIILAGLISMKKFGG